MGTGDSLVVSATELQNFEPGGGREAEAVDPLSLSPAWCSD